MKKTKMALIIGSIIMCFGVVGSICSGVVLIPSVLNDISVARNDKSIETENYIIESNEKIKKLNIEFDSYNMCHYDVKIKRAMDGKFSVNVGNSLIDKDKIVANYNKEKNEMNISGNIEYGLNYKYEGVSKFLNDSYKYFINTIAEGNINGSIEIYVPEAVELNIKINDYAGLEIEGGTVKDRLDINGGIDIQVPNQLNVKELNIKGDHNINLDVKQLLGIEKVNIQSYSICIESLDDKAIYDNVNSLSKEINLKASGDINIRSYIPIAEKLNINSYSVEIGMPFHEFKIKTVYNINKENLTYEEIGFGSVENVVVHEEKNGIKGFSTNGNRLNSEIIINSEGIKLENLNKDFLN